MDQVDTLHVGRYWSELLCCIIITVLGGLEVKIMDLGGHSVSDSYLNLNKNMKTYIRLKQHKNSALKHKTNGTTTDVSPWNDQ